MRDQLRHLSADVAEEGPQRGEALVARRDRAVALLLEMSEEAADDVGRDLLDGHVDGIGGMCRGQIPEEQAEGVSVVVLGIDAEVAIRNHVLDEKATDEGAKRMRRRHGATSPASAAYPAKRCEAAASSAGVIVRYV